MSTAEVLAAWESDTSIVEHALAHVRYVARLDDDPILPKLPPASRSGVAAIPSPAILFLPPVPEIVKPLATPAEQSAPKAKDTYRTRAAAKTRKGSRWPVRMCGLVALGFAAKAFLASPVGHRPEVVKVTATARTNAWTAYQGAVAFVHAHVR